MCAARIAKGWRTKEIVDGEKRVARLVAARKARGRSWRARGESSWAVRDAMSECSLQVARGDYEMSATGKMWTVWRRHQKLKVGLPRHVMLPEPVPTSHPGRVLCNRDCLFPNGSSRSYNRKDDSVVDRYETRIRRTEERRQHLLSYLGGYSTVRHGLRVQCDRVSTGRDLPVMSL